MNLSAPDKSPLESRKAPVIGRPVWIVLAILTSLRLLVAANVGLTEDECYYRLWALNPSWGYLDHPPMVAWWIAAGQLLLGDGSLAIRVSSVMAVALGSLVLWRIAWLLTGSNRLADRAVLWMQASLLLGLGSVIMTPDSPSVLFWLLSVWTLVELDQSGNANWLLAMGVFSGLGLQSKYSGLFFGAGVVLWFLLDVSSRRWWKVPQLYLGGLLAIAIFLPVIDWNAQHHWASFGKQFGRAAVRQWSFRYLGEFLGTLIGLLNPLLVVFTVRSLVQMRSGGSNARPIRMLGIIALPFFAYLMIHSLHDRVQANWPAALFPGFVLLSALAAEDLPPSAGTWLMLRRAVAPFGIGLSLTAMAWALRPLGKSDIKGDPTARLRGWNELSVKVESVRRSASASWIATDRYALTGILSYELRGTTTPIVQLTERIRYCNQPDPNIGILATPGIYVTLARNDRSSTLRECFGRVEYLGTIQRAPRGLELGVYAIYRLAEPLDPNLDWKSLSACLSPAIPGSD